MATTGAGVIVNQQNRDELAAGTQTAGDLNVRNNLTANTADFTGGLTVGQTLNLSLILQPAGATESVTVTSDAPIVCGPAVTGTLKLRAFANFNCSPSRVFQGASSLPSWVGSVISISKAACNRLRVGNRRL